MGGADIMPAHDPYQGLPQKIKDEILGQPRGPKPKRQDLLVEAFRHKVRADKLTEAGDVLRADYWRKKEQEKLAEAEKAED